MLERAIVRFEAPTGRCDCELADRAAIPHPSHAVRRSGRRAQLDRSCRQLLRWRLPGHLPRERPGKYDRRDPRTDDRRDLLGARLRGPATWSGTRPQVVVPMPNGQDPHEWEPSAKDIETIMNADLVVQNGLGLEGGMEKTLHRPSGGVKFFTASDHITVRKVGAGEGIPRGDPDQAVGAEDPHLWMDPLVMKAVVVALAAQLKTDLGLDVSARRAGPRRRLDGLDKELPARCEASRRPSASW